MLRPAVAALLAAALLLIFADRFVLIEIFVRRDGVAILLAIIEAIAIIGAGRLILRRRSDPVKAFLVGYPLFGAACFLVGLIHVSVWTMTPLLIFFVIVGVIALVGERRSDAGSVSGGAATPTMHAPTTWAVVPVGIVFLCALVMAQAPPVTLDELAYHLAIPRAWVLEGRAIELPLISHSYFPLGIESADLPSLTLLDRQGAITSHFLHLFAAIATTILILRRSRSWIVTAGIVATPALALTAGWSLVDWPLLGICIVFVDALDKDEHRSITASMAAGLLTKYTFIPFALIAIVAGRSLKKGVLPGLALGSLFFFRNFVLTWNPVAPFFGSDAPHVSGYRALSLPGYLFDGRFIDEALGASLITLSLLTAGLAAWLLVGAAAALFFLGPSSRILVPFLAIPAMQARNGTRVIRFILAIAIAMQCFLVVFYTHRSGAFSLLSAEVSDEEYILEQRPSVEAVSWLNANLPDKSRTLVIGLNETFWFSRRVRAGGNFDGPRVSRYVEAPTEEALRLRLERDGITHIAVVAAAVPTRVGTKQDERITRLTPAAQKSLARLLDRYAVSVASRGGATLFALR
jgi:hypothetical protein